MNWDDARIFLAVAREGQLLGAARRLGLNHATVGRRLSALERSLSLRLVERRPSGSVLTEEGERFRERCERMEREWLETQSRAENQSGTLSGRVRIGAPDGFGTAFLAARLSPLLERNPDLAVELVPVPRSFSLSRREADIAVTLDRPDQGRLVSQKLTDYSLGLFASKGYLERHPAPETLENLARHRLIGPVEDLLWSPSAAYSADLSVSWASRLDVSSALGQLEAAAGGAGVAILHRFMADRRPELVHLLPSIAVRRSYWIVLHEASSDIPRIQGVRSFVLDLVRAERAIF